MLVCRFSFGLVEKSHFVVFSTTYHIFVYWNSRVVLTLLHNLMKYHALRVSVVATAVLFIALVFSSCADILFKYLQKETRIPPEIDTHSVLVFNSTKNPSGENVRQACKEQDISLERWINWTEIDIDRVTGTLSEERTRLAEALREVDALRMKGQGYVVFSPSVKLFSLRT